MQRLIALLCALLAASALAACSSDKPKKDSGKSGSAAATSTASQPGKPATCRSVKAPKPKPAGKLKRPTLKLDPKKSWTVEMKTTCGSFTIALDVKRAPKTSASFASLTKLGFYDRLTFHRVVPSFVIQGGDPRGNGQGGPGYSVVEAPPDNLIYSKGLVAMAKTDIEDPGTSGSQFYVVTAQDAGLPAEYALVGAVVAGQDVVDRIGAVQTDPQTEAPLRPVVIEKATLASK